jgi:hypothetical protein
MAWVDRFSNGWSGVGVTVQHLERMAAAPLGQGKSRCDHTEVQQREIVGNFPRAG